MKYLLVFLPLGLPYLLAVVAWFVWAKTKIPWLQWLGCTVFWLMVAVVLGWMWQATNIMLHWWGFR